jgi:glycosyltransferase involved in cell wall biosynthesis
MPNFAPKITIVICANNEAETKTNNPIGKTLDLLLAQPFPMRIIVVDDGSTDFTSEVLKAYSAKTDFIEIVTMKKNVGKANAFFAGLKKAVERPCDAIVTLDADMLTIPTQSIAKLILYAARKTKSNESYMYVGNQKEFNKELRQAYSISSNLVGIRSFSYPAAWHILKNSVRTKVTGFALESFLNFLFQEKQEYVSDAIFKTDEPFRKPVERQIEDVTKFMQRIDKKRKLDPLSKPLAKRAVTRRP